MPGTTAATGVLQLQHQRKGVMAMSLTDFGMTTVSQIALGSGMEIAGAWVDFLANESMGATWAAMAVGDVYARVDSVALTSEYTETAPTWDTELQGYYDATKQYKYYAKFYKDAGGNYLQKALYTSQRGVMITYEGIALNTGANADQLMRLANDCRFLWDESETRVDLDKTLHLSAGGLTIAAGNITLANGYYLNGVKKTVSSVTADTQTENTLFDALSPYIPNINDTIVVSGAVYAIGAGIGYSISKAIRHDATTIYLYGYNQTDHTMDIVTITDGGVLTYHINLAW